ncbi:hypothetical protein B0H34DRAFT_669430, partial [Crassisporium funariophilum]
KEDRMVVGHSLASCNTKTEYAVIDRIAHRRRVVVVDTPGFNDESKRDTAILQKIVDCAHGITLGGVIYLHDISRDRFSTMALTNLGMLHQSFSKSEEALQRIIFATTKWDRVRNDEGVTREKELKDTRWKSLIGRGSKVRALSFDCAWTIIDDLLGCVEGDATLDIKAQLAKLRKLQGIREDKTNSLLPSYSSPNHGALWTEVKVILDDVWRPGDV